MNKLITVVLSLTLWTCAVQADDDKPVKFSQIPQKAQTFIKKHFSATDISYAKMESDFFDKTYDVYFTNGNNVEFDKKGEWKEVVCKVVPVAIIPEAIQKHLNEKHPGSQVTKIERSKHETERFEVKLSDGKDLKFDKNGQFLRFD